MLIRLPFQAQVTGTPPTTLTTTISVTPSGFSNAGQPVAPPAQCGNPQPTAQPAQNISQCPHPAPGQCVPGPDWHDLTIGYSWDPVNCVCVHHTEGKPPTVSKEEAICKTQVSKHTFTEAFEQYTDRSSVRIRPRYLQDLGRKLGSCRSQNANRKLWHRDTMGRERRSGRLLEEWLLVARKWHASYRH